MKLGNRFLTIGEGNYKYENEKENWNEPKSVGLELEL